ncbi:MAG: hypothetical protein WDK96_00615 [Candidatus Paceibacterota bacterium]|jgi:hypothetical protein
MQYIKKQSGFLKLIILIIIAVFILSFLNVDVQSKIESPQIKNDLVYIKENSIIVWDKYLSEPLSYLWNSVFITTLVNSFVDGIKKLKNGEPVDFQLMAPQV